jgi:hypothetical protein
MRLYVNGQYDNQMSLRDMGYSAVSLPNSQPLNLGSGFIGGIDEVRLYNTPISTSQVQAIYQASTPAPVTWPASATAASSATVTTLPTISQPTATAIAPTSATLGATVGSDGGAPIITRGVLLIPQSQAAGSSVIVRGAPGVIEVDVAGTTGTFSVNVAGLAPDTVYLYCAFASNAAGLTSTTAALTFTTSFAASNQAVSTSHGQALPITLSSNAASGDLLTYLIISGPAHGTLSGTGANLVYTPATGYSGLDTFQYQVIDNTTGVTSSIGTVSLTVNP